MGGGSSKEKRRRRRRRERDRGEGGPVGDDFGFEDETAPGREAAGFEAQQRKSNRSMGKMSDGSELVKYHVKTSDGKKGFTLNQDTLMITDVTSVDLQRELLPPGSIVRIVDGAEVFDMDQFNKHTRGKECYSIGVFTPEMLGVWKVRQNVPHRRITVHPESLAAQAAHKNFPKETQIARAVNGHELRNYGDYEFLTKDKNKFFITVSPSDPSFHTDTSITQFLGLVKQYPNLSTPEDIATIQGVLLEGIDAIRGELEYRAEDRPVNYPHQNKGKNLPPPVFQPPPDPMEDAAAEEPAPRSARPPKRKKSSGRKKKKKKRSRSKRGR